MDTRDLVVEKLTKDIQKPRGMTWKTGLALFKSPRTRRCLVFDAYADPVWIDDDDRCDKAMENDEGQPRTHHFGDRIPTGWHMYVGMDGRRLVLRCPRSLSEAEKVRIVIDEPPGHWRAVQGERKKIRGMPTREKNFEGVDGSSYWK